MDGTIDWVQKAEAPSDREISSGVDIMDNAQEFGTQCQELKCRIINHGRRFCDADVFQRHSKDYARPLASTRFP